MSHTAWITLFSLVALSAGLPACWLLLRRQTAAAWAGAAALALLATASGFMGWQLAHAPAPLPAFTLAPPTPGQFQTIPPAALEQVLQSVRGHPVLLEFYADWCSSCLVWKNQVLNRPDVQTALTPFILLRIDATEMTADTQQALNRFDLAGLPALISFAADGRELKAMRILGEMPAAGFIRELQTRILPAARSQSPGVR
jgi:thiol:disulfide interchange protein